MAQKRKIEVAFGKSNGQLSAFAAAKLRKSGHSTPTDDRVAVDGTNADRIAAAIATVPYDDDEDGGQAVPSRVEAESAALPVVRKGPAQRLSTLRQSSAIRDDGDCLELALAVGDTLTLVGEYELKVANGVATIYGATLYAGSSLQRVYAPSTQALPVITARKAPTVLRISSVKSSIGKLDRISPLFRNIWASDPKGRSFSVLQTTHDDPLQRMLNTLEIDTAAQKILTQISGRSIDQGGMIRAMTVGPKSSGKSTFNRHLCNALVSNFAERRCLFLDLDPGQPEFGPPGQLSLVEVRVPIVGPAFTHVASKTSKQYRLLATHTIAATSFKDDPKHYMACVQDLFNGCRHRLSGLNAQPVVVNACGWITGLGAAVLADIYDIIGITDSVVLEGDVALAEMAQAQSEYYYKLARASARQSLRTPAELRAMQSMSYFHSRPTTIARWTCKAISSIRPLVVDYAGPDAGISAIMSYGEILPPEFLGEVLDGSLVAIVTADQDDDLPAILSASLGREQAADDQALPSYDDLIQETPDGLPYVPPDASGFLSSLDPSQTTCHGLALIRAIDTEAKELCLVTPLHESEIGALMMKKVILVRGGFDQPDRTYLEDLYAADARGQSADVSDRPWVTRKGMVGVEGAVWRLRHPPTASQLAGNG